MGELRGGNGGMKQLLNGLAKTCNGRLELVPIINGLGNEVMGSLLRGK